MSPVDRDRSRRVDPAGDAQPRASGPWGSNADTANSAAHIAELVRRTAERGARPGPSPVARPPTAPPTAKVAVPSATVAVPSATVDPTFAMPAHRVAQAVEQPDTSPARPAVRPPSRRTLIVAGAIAVVLIGGGLALSHLLGSDAAATSPSSSTSSAARNAAPAGYAVKVTDVITNCASHAHGRTKASFERQNCVKATRLLATGRVGGRPVLFVVSRIRMASPEAAASVKQVLDGSGTGNLNDLLREGRTFPGAPEKMPASGYASVQMSTVVSVAEAGFVDDGRSSSTDPPLRAAAAEVAALVSPQS